MTPPPENDEPRAVVVARAIAAELAGLASMAAAIYIAVTPGHGVSDPAFPALVALAGMYLGAKSR